MKKNIVLLIGFLFFLGGCNTNSEIIYECRNPLAADSAFTAFYTKNNTINKVVTAMGDYYENLGITETLAKEALPASFKELEQLEGTEIKYTFNEDSFIIELTVDYEILDPELAVKYNFSHPDSNLDLYRDLEKVLQYREDNLVDKCVEK